jgi:GT2 family glycosyltransferase
VVRLPRAQAPLVVAVPSYNGRHLLEQILPSLAAQTFREFRVVIVDDASQDGTVPWLRGAWPEAEVVALERNGGVTAAFNHCLAAAGDAELVALFNNDMELAADCLGELVEAMRRHPEAGSATAKLIDFHRRELLDGAGDVFSWTAMAARRGHGEPDDGRYDEPQPVFGACGGAAVYRRAALEDVGGFDEAFHAFSEDVDWALRAQLAGWECRYVPTAVAFHMGSATLGPGLTDFTAYHLWRNAVWIVAKDFPAAALVRRAPHIALGLMTNLAAAWWERKLDLWRRAMRDAVRGLPGALRRRRAVQRRRRRSLRELDAVMRG